MTPLFTNHGKTVYILGAGFSRGAGFPLQAEILDRVEALSLMDVPEDTLQKFLLLSPQRDWQSFKDRTLPKEETPSLEDVFTLLDQTISNRGFFAGFSVTDLESVREALKRAILFVFHSAGATVEKGSSEFYRMVAAYLLERRARSGQKGDPVAVISLNWDYLLESNFRWCVEQLDAHDNVGIDYCCYSMPLSKDWHDVPSVLMKAKGLFNIKILKLHGSANWLICPNCNSLYTGISALGEIWDEFLRPHPCPSCKQTLPNTFENSKEKHPQLEPFIITPTFLKVFDNPHIQMSWHNAYLELAEASEVVFIGYSLPLADFHLRTLLRRAINPRASVVVVLTENDKPKRNTAKRLWGYFASTRYREFFGADRVVFEFGGVENYFRRTMGGTTMESRLDTLRRIVKG